jgi:hypothetical protein
MIERVDREGRQRHRRELLGVLSVERPTHAPECLLDRLVVADLELIEIGVEGGLQRRVGVEAERVGPQQLAQTGLAELRHQLVDEQRRLEVRERDRLRVRERLVQIVQLQRLAAIEALSELDVHFTAPFGPCALLLVDRDAFGEPAWHALVRHLDRDHVRQLVPERRLPLKGARRPGPGRIHRDHAAEAGASAPIIPGSPTFLTASRRGAGRPR